MHVLKDLAFWSCRLKRLSSLTVQQHRVGRQRWSVAILFRSLLEFDVIRCADQRQRLAHLRHQDNDHLAGYCLTRETFQSFHKTRSPRCTLRGRPKGGGLLRLLATRQLKEINKSVQEDSGFNRPTH